MKARAAGGAARSAIALLASLLLASCSLADRQLLFPSTAPPDDLRDDVRQLQQAVADLQRRSRPQPSADVGLSRRLDRVAKDVGEVRKQLGDLRARMDAVEEQSRRIGDINQQAIRAEQKAQEARSEAQRVEGDLSKQVAALADRVKQLEQTAQLAARTQAPATATAPGRPPAAASPPEPKVTTGQSLYDEGYSLYKDRKYQAAREKFQDYVRLYPDTSLTDNAYYWIGETYYEQAQNEKNPSYYEKAILEYDRVIQQFPKADKVSSALYKQALAFDAIGDPTDAKILLRKLIRDFAGSEQATMAKRKLDALGD